MVKGWFVVYYPRVVAFPGNLPSSLESSGSDRLVHWCHGAPGFTHLLAHAYRVSRQPVQMSVCYEILCLSCCARRHLHN